MIYIVYGLSGTLKRVLIDFLPCGDAEVSLAITVDQRGVFDKKINQEVIRKLFTTESC